MCRCEEIIVMANEIVGFDSLIYFILFYFIRLVILNELTIKLNV